MKSEEKQNSMNTFDTNEKINTISKNNFDKDKTITPQKKPLYLNIMNNPILKIFNLQKQKTDFNLKTDSPKKNTHFPLLTFNSISNYDSPTNSKLEIEALKNKLIVNKTNINKKKQELQELKIQYKKLLDENKTNKNLISNILQLDNEQNSNSIETDPYMAGGLGVINISEEQLIARINDCKINEAQEQKLKASIELINLREQINAKKKLLLSKNKEYDKLKDILKFKKKNEMNDKLEDLTKESENLKREIPKLEEILQKNNKERMPKLEEELEKTEKNSEEINKKEKEYKKDFNDKIKKLAELKQEIEYLESKVNSKKISINKIPNSSEYKGTKVTSLKLKSKIEKMKLELELINK